MDQRVHTLKEDAPAPNEVAGSLVQSIGIRLIAEPENQCHRITTRFRYPEWMGMRLGPAADEDRGRIAAAARSRVG